MKVDPFPQTKVDMLKASMRVECEQMILANMKKRKGPASSSSNAIDSEDDVAQLNVETTSLQDLVLQINDMNDKIPKRLEKFQQALEERQKVTDAKMKRMIKESSDKVQKSVKGQNDGVEKLKKGLQNTQQMINQIKAEIAQLRKGSSSAADSNNFLQVPEAK